MIPKHFRPAGQITDRLLGDPELTLDGWWPTRDASLRTRCRPAAVGYRVGQRRRSSRRTYWLDFTTTLANITFPSMALWLLLLAIQGQHLIYVAQTVVMLP